MIRYGFQRLVLLNSAGYSRAELPLDDSVSLIAPNNTGKTSLINSLQFLLIIDRRRMDFGPKDIDESRKFYFPDNSSYILLEVALPTAGTVVMGCVGRGVGHDYQYFVFKGELDLDDFRLPDGGIVQQPHLVAHMASRGKLVATYSSGDFAEILYGRGNRKFGQHEVDFRVFKLEDNRHAEIYQRVLTRTLRLDQLSSNEVKEYLLAIFRRDMPDSSIDFKAEWDKAFAEVNADKAQYLAAMKLLPTIEELRDLHAKRLELRGKILHYRPSIDAALQQWSAHYQKQKQEIDTRVSECGKQQEKILPRATELSRRDLEIEGKLNEITEARDRQTELEKEFALISSRSILEQALAVDRANLDRQIGLLQSSEGRSVDAIRRDQEDLTRLRQQLEREQASLQDNLFLRLKSILDAEQLDALNRVISQQTMTLAASDFEMAPTALLEWVSSAEAGALHLPGLKISLASLLPLHTQRSAAEIMQRLDELSLQERSLSSQMDTANDRAKAMTEKTRLEGIVRDGEGQLLRYDELQQLVGQRQQREDQKQRLSDERSSIKKELEQLQSASGELNAIVTRVQEELAALNLQNSEITRLRDNRGDGDSSFDHLADLPHRTWLGGRAVAVDTLAEDLVWYRQDCDSLRYANVQIERGLSQVHIGGLTKFQFSGGGEDEIERIVDFADNLSKEAEALERKTRSQVVNVTACLRELRDGLLTFQSKMNEINRLLSRRQISDLDVFRIDPVEEKYLVDAINTLISSAEKASIGETFHMFNHGSVLEDDDLNKAKEILIKEGEVHGCLKVEHFFRLVFTVGKKGDKPESFYELDKAASMGTALIAKLVTGLSMLYLMQDKRNAVNTTCYLDESATLDSRNVRNLIETAGEFGFSLILAAPVAAPAARYCVPISRRSGRNSISRKDWEILDPLTGARSKGAPATTDEMAVTA